MDLVLFEFVRKWLETGRFPREELRIRWWIAALGILVIGGLGVALLVVAVS